MEVSIFYALKCDYSFIRDFLFFLLGYFLLGGFVLWLSSMIGIDIAPKNEETVSNQLQTIPVYLTVIQICIFTLIIEEMTFRYSIIGTISLI